MTVGMRRGLAAMLAALVIPALAGCGGDPGAPKPISPVASSTTVTPTESPSSTPSWAAHYTQKQLDQYHQALASWNAYERASAPIWAAGKVTPKARRVFNRYWYTPELMLNQLKGAQAAGMRITGSTRVLTSRPEQVERGVVVIRQCVDASRGIVTINGQVQPAAKHPFRRIVDIEKSPGEPWRILRLKDPSTRWVRRCTAP